MFCLVEIFVRKFVGGIQIKIEQSFVPHNTFARSRGTRANITAMTTRYSTHAFTSTSSSSYLSSQRQSAPLTRRKSCHPQRGLMNKFAADEVMEVETISIDGSAKPSEASPFPLLSNKQPLYTHVSPGVCDMHASDVTIRAAWVVLLRSQHASHRANAKRTKDMFHEEDESFLDRYHEWEAKYDDFLSRVESDSYQGGTLLNVVSEKEKLLREYGLPDLFRAVKAAENALCSDVLFQSLRDDVDNSEDSLKASIEIALAGNLFDAGAAQAVQNVVGGTAFKGDSNKFAFKNSEDLQFAFEASRRRVRNSEWLCDDLDKLRANEYDRVCVFCDNAGADVLGMTLLARELAKRTKGAKVALIANELAALNDVTINELEEFYEACEQHDRNCLQKYRENGKIVLLSSGQSSTLLNLNTTGKDVNDWVKCEDTVSRSDMEGGKLRWLVVLDGMGRSLESNWECGKYVQPHVDVLNLAMVKSEINANRLGANVYDCVCKLSNSR